MCLCVNSRLPYGLLRPPTYTHTRTRTLSRLVMRVLRASAWKLLSLIAVFPYNYTSVCHKDFTFSLTILVSRINVLPRSITSPLLSLLSGHATAPFNCFFYFSIETANYMSDAKELHIIKVIETCHSREVQSYRHLPVMPHTSWRDQYFKSHLLSSLRVCQYVLQLLLKPGSCLDFFGFGFLKWKRNSFRDALRQIQRKKDKI